MHLSITIQKVSSILNNYPPNDPNNPYSQPTTAGSYPQFPPAGQQPPPPYPQPGQFGTPPQSTPDKLPWFNIKARKEYFQRHPEAKKKQALIGCGLLIGIFLLCGICSAIGNASNATKQPTTASVSQSTPQITTTIAPTSTKAATPVPTPTETPTPTQAPVQSQPVQQPATQSQPQQPAPVSGVNNNPWGYDFNPGSYIYNPNSGFCGYFSCVSTFWTSTNGYVVQCANNEYSHSGGVRGACSRDGGVEATLYQHP